LQSEGRPEVEPQVSRGRDGAARWQCGRHRGL